MPGANSGSAGPGQSKFTELMVSKCTLETNKNCNLNDQNFYLTVTGLYFELAMVGDILDLSKKKQRPVT